MADATRVGNGFEAHRFENKSSSTAVSKARYSLDGMGENEAGDDVYDRANPARPGFTKSDQRDMYRMGKIQELKVGRSFAHNGSWTSTSSLRVLV